MISRHLNKLIFFVGIYVFNFKDLRLQLPHYTKKKSNALLGSCKSSSSSQSARKAPIFPNINPLLEVIQPPKGQPDRHYTTQSRKKLKKGIVWVNSLKSTHIKFFEQSNLKKLHTEDLKQKFVKDAYYNSLILGDIHFLRRRPRGEGGQPNFYFTKQPYLVKLGRGVKKVQNLV